MKLSLVPVVTNGARVNAYRVPMWYMASMRNVRSVLVGFAAPPAVQVCFSWIHVPSSVKLFDPNECMYARSTARSVNRLVAPTTPAGNTPAAIPQVPTEREFWPHTFRNATLPYGAAPLVTPV